MSSLVSNELLFRYCLVAKRWAVWLTWAVDWVGVESGAFSWFRVRYRYMAAGVQSAIGRSCILLSSRSILDCVGMKGVAVAGVGLFLVGAVAGSAASLSGGVVGTDA